MDDKEKQEFIACNMEKRFSSFIGMYGIRNNPAVYKTHYPTGFAKLDETLGGGLTSGLHCLGAISSLGKSTLALQMAENMVSENIHCIIFSLEMKAMDLAAKAVSRQTYIGTQGDLNLAKTSDTLRNEMTAALFSDEEWAAIERASAAVEQKSQYISVVECGSDPYNVDRIGKYVQDYIQAFGVKPVVVVDYLQILDPPRTLKSAPDKQIADYNLKRLKVLSDYFSLPVILISSFNRENYDAEVTFKSFKDSGNIEYSCDTVMGLQLTGVGKEGFDAETAKARYPREVELKILKQRYGPVNAKIPFRFYTKFNYFEEVSRKSASVPPNSTQPAGKRRVY